MEVKKKYFGFERKLKRERYPWFHEKNYNYCYAKNYYAK